MARRNWPVQIIGAYFFYFRLSALFHILYLRLILLTIMQCSWIGEACVAEPLGTWIRIPGPPKLCYIFSSGTQMQRFRQGASYTSRSHVPGGSRSRPSGPGWGSPWTLINKRPGNLKVQQAGRLGLEIAIHTPFTSPTPLSLFLYFSFHCFYFIIIIN